MKFRLSAETCISPRTLACSCLIAVLTASAHAALTSGLVHHWNFDEGPDWHDNAFQSVCTGTVAYDSVGGANATLQNMAGSNWVSGRQFTALDFDGVNEHLTVATNLASTLGGTASLSFWLRTTQTGAVSAATSPGVAGVAGTGGAQWGWLDDAGRIALVRGQHARRPLHQRRQRRQVASRRAHPRQRERRGPGVSGWRVVRRQPPAPTGARISVLHQPGPDRERRQPEVFRRAAGSGPRLQSRHLQRGSGDVAHEPRAQVLGHHHRGGERPRVQHREHFLPGLTTWRTTRWRCRAGPSPRTAR